MSGEIGKVYFEPIGVIRTPFRTRNDAPFRPGDARGEVIVRQGLQEGLQDLEGFSHVVLVFHFHLSEGYTLTPTPPRETEPKGLFATRSPNRPNGIGVSPVRLIGIEGIVLKVEGVDMIDGTPLLDIKPYIPYVDSDEIALGWLAGSRHEEGA